MTDVTGANLKSVHRNFSGSRKKNAGNGKSFSIPAFSDIRGLILNRTSILFIDEFNESRASAAMNQFHPRLS